MGSSQEYYLQQQLQSLPEELHKDFEKLYDDMCWKRRVEQFKLERTLLGRVLELWFLSLVIARLVAIFGEDKIKVVTNFGKQGYDIYIKLVSIGKWLIIELKNWHTYIVTPDMLNENFFYRKPYVRIDDQIIKLEEQDIIGRILVFSEEIKLEEEARRKLANNGITVLMGSEVFENEREISILQRMFLNDCLTKITAMIKHLLPVENNDAATSDLAFYLLQLVHLHVVPVFFGKNGVYNTESDDTTTSKRPPDIPILTKFPQSTTPTSILKSKLSTLFRTLIHRLFS